MNFGLLSNSLPQRSFSTLLMLRDGVSGTGGGPNRSTRVLDALGDD